MSYNRWMPRQYHNGGELYHYGVKGMKWGKHLMSKGVEESYLCFKTRWTIAYYYEWSYLARRGDQTSN